MSLLQERKARGGSQQQRRRAGLFNSQLKHNICSALCIMLSPKPCDFYVGRHRPRVMSRRQMETCLISALAVVCLLSPPSIAGAAAVPPPAAATADPGDRQVVQLPLANGFVHLSFQPSALHVPLGETRSGFINVSIDDHALQDLPVLIHQCCEDPDIATLTRASQHFVVRNQTALLVVEARGTRLGRTSLKFYVARNDTARESSRQQTYGRDASSDENIPGKQQQHHSALDATKPSLARHGPQAKDRDRARNAQENSGSDPQNHPNPESANHVKLKQLENMKNSELVSTTPSGGVVHALGQNLTGQRGWTEIWWIPTEYEVLVGSPQNTAGPYLYYAIMVLVGFNLIGLGGQIDTGEVTELVKKPLAVTVGFFCRFVVMPALGLGLVELMQPSRPTSLGVLTLTCAPAEGASTLLVMLAELDLTFSVTLTVINNFATVAMMPLWTIVFENRIYDAPGNVSIPIPMIFVIFGYMITSVGLGVLVRRKNPRFMFRYWTYLPSFTVLTVVFILVVEIYNNYFVFSLVTASVFFQSTLLAMSGFLFSGAMAFIARQSHSKIAVISLETGVRTTYITNLLLVDSLPKPEGDVAKTAPVLCAFMTLLPTFFLVLVYRMLHRYRKVKYASTVEGAYMTQEEEDVEELCKDSEFVDSKETAM